MKLKFYKYQGAGNDFVLIDNRNKTLTVDVKLFAHLCDRRFGIGGDGIMLLQNHPGFDFEMIYANSDGRPSTMCGNGGRCITAFANHLGIFNAETNFIAVDGPHYAKLTEKGVSLEMIDVSEIESNSDFFVLNTGSPHYVKEVSDVKDLNVFESGRSIRYNDRFKAEGINVNFVEDKGDHLIVRTYERGVEDETLACGTGVTAVALAMMKKKGLTGTHTTHIKAMGGDLSVTATTSDGNAFTSVFLEGPADYVFEGEIEIETV
ncbi:diaminopimelate epimerase [Solitalea canadensis]|uniref:Diaminopimelate epimerase n=1 Tax=Solitalea canadensis (strain ATCC 29591 / DSM 3403 / JCM 21819 / LMG 8368 / NBRC 15130 / NCIMB 12057 / USAM 9D) TaxID=929556 RepID=H8KMH5_SOLCM|nr:diaminopimelate epimerase [Solitalea canadensis]AFD08770.1 diaminopimelate epimerase [Solitalea canadensis DSM 3403]